MSNTDTAIVFLTTADIRATTALVMDRLGAVNAAIADPRHLDLAAPARTIGAPCHPALRPALRAGPRTAVLDQRHALEDHGGHPDSNPLRAVPVCPGWIMVFGQSRA